MLCPFIIKKKELEKVLLVLLNRSREVGMKVLAESKKLKCLQIPPNVIE